MSGEEIKCKCGRPVVYRPNSTIQPKECPRCLLQKHVAGKSGWDDPGKKKAKSKRRTAMETADKWFSRYIRIKYSYQVIDGEVICRDIITGKLYSARNIDCGHYFSRAHMATRYHEDNCRPQNRSSNRFSGEADKLKFEINLRKEIGDERFKIINDLHKEPMRWFGAITNDEYLKVVADTYRLKVNQLCKENVIKKWW